jgi:hypothetical protein
LIIFFFILVYICIIWFRIDVERIVHINIIIKIIFDNIIVNMIVENIVIYIWLNFFDFFI